MVEPKTIIPHDSLGADCCGCLMAVMRGDEADVVCNERGALIRTFPLPNLRKRLRNWRFLRDLLALRSSESIPRSLVNLIQAFICRECCEGNGRPSCLPRAMGRAFSRDGPDSSGNGPGAEFGIPSLRDHRRVLAPRARLSGAFFRYAE
jgi:hypothetical protein